MTDLHEDPGQLSAACRDLHRAISSLREELEAVDWYQQRVEACTDEELRRVLAHNRDEEIEHACMTLEWLRRSVPTWDQNLRKYLFTTGSIAATEHAAKEGANDVARGLGLGRLAGGGS